MCMWSDFGCVPTTFTLHVPTHPKKPPENLSLSTLEIRGSPQLFMALQRALDWRAPHLARLLAHGTAKNFGTQVHTSTVCQKSLGGVPIKG